jgi:ABC-type molybdate transport system ATPase subunit
MHLPSVVTHHNSPSRRTERGNIVVWEQLLTDRQKSATLEVQARMETQSILFRTLALFGAMGVLVVLTFIAAIWFVRSRKTSET